MCTVELCEMSPMKPAHRPLPPPRAPSGTLPDTTPPTVNTSLNSKSIERILSVFVFEMNGVIQYGVFMFK